ncbi:disease resistance protein RPM1-like [Fagus crenata]
MAETTVNLVKEYLVPLLVQEARLLKGIHEEVTSIKREMEMIQSFLKDADTKAEKDDTGSVAKTWVKQVREEAFHIEDVIDEYLLHFAKAPHRRRRSFRFLQKVFHITINLKRRHVIASEIQGINTILEDIRKRGERYGFNAIEQGRSNSDSRSDTWHDPRMASLFIEEAEVVGIESHREKLIKWLVEGSSNRLVFSVVGIGGLGKTTLVKKVYENDKVAAHFDSRAWITVSQSYKTKEILRDIIKQLYKARKESIPGDIDTMKETQLMEQLRLYLHEHRVDEVPDSFLTTCFANFKLMKTMDFEGALIDYIPEEVGNLFHLKYLSLGDTKVEKLPKSIGKLKNLETLDLKHSRVSELPVEISGLSKLRYLAAYIEDCDIEFNINFRQGVKIHSGISCLQSLERIEANNTALITELGSLGQLRKLEISKLKRECGIALCTTLKKMSYLRSLKISATSEEEFLELQLMSSPPPLLQTLSLRGRLEKLPKWIPQLKSIVKIGLIFSRLMDDPFRVLQALPNLMHLVLTNGYEGSVLIFGWCC